MRTLRSLRSLRSLRWKYLYEKSIKIDTKKLKGIKDREEFFRLKISNYRIVYFEDVKW